MKATEIKFGGIYRGRRGDTRKVVEMRKPRGPFGWEVQWRDADERTGCMLLQSFARWAREEVVHE